MSVVQERNSENRVMHITEEKQQKRYDQEEASKRQITKEEEKKSETINATNNYNTLITHIHHNNLENKNPFCNA